MESLLEFTALPFSGLRRASLCLGLLCPPLRRLKSPGCPGGHFDPALHSPAVPPFHPLPRFPCLPPSNNCRHRRNQEEAMPRTGANYCLTPADSFHSINHCISPGQTNWKGRLASFPGPSPALFFFLQSPHHGPIQSLLRPFFSSCKERKAICFRSGSWLRPKDIATFGLIRSRLVIA